MSNAIKIFSAVFVLSIICYFAVNKQVAAIEQANTAIVAGVIRSEDERGWYAIDDKNHAPVNIKSIEVHHGIIIINYTFEGKKINSFIATVDETFAHKGYIVGSSVTRDKARIHITQIKNGECIPVDASTIRSKWGNIWIYGLFEV